MDPSSLATCRSVFTEMASNWAVVSAATTMGARRGAEAQVFGQMVVALAGWIGPMEVQLAGVPNKSAQTVGAIAPLRELQLLAHGITSPQGRFPVDSSQIWRADQSITGHHPGDRIAMTASGFSQLCDACLHSIGG